MEGTPVSLSAAAEDPSTSSVGAEQRVAQLTDPLEVPLARARRGEIAGFRELIRAHQDSVYTLALRMLKVPEDAEELAQDVFVSLHRHLGKIASAPHLLFWLRRTVCHRAIDRLRRRSSRLAMPLEDAKELPQPDESPDPLLERHLRAVVMSLAPVPRAVVLLRYQEDLDPPEIARVMDMPLNTVKSHLKRSLALLRRGCDELREPISAGNQT